MSLDELVAIVTDPTTSDEAKRLAISVAYQKGVTDEKLVAIKRDAARLGIEVPA